MAVKWTERAASPAEEFPVGGAPAERNVELPRAKGPDGQPLVVTIRRIDAFDAMDHPEGLSGPQANRYLAERSVVSPNLFETNGHGPRWNALSLIDQMALIEAIASLNTEGMGEVAAAADAFPAGQKSGSGRNEGAGGVGDGRGGDLPDAPGEPAVSAAGEGASAAEGSASV